MFRKMPVILSAIIILILGIHPWVPLVYQSILYGVSLSIKSLIVFILPFLVFALLFKAAAQLVKQASKWIVGILLAVCISNFISTFLSYTVAKVAYGLDLSIAVPIGIDSLSPIGAFSLPKWIENSYAMFSGLILGAILGYSKPKAAEKISLFLEKGIALCLKFFLFLIPLFIIGFVFKLVQDGMMGLILENYSLIFGLVTGTVFSYVFLLYAITTGFRIKTSLVSLKNMLPAAIAGFGSMSSAAAMPLTLIGTEKNAKNPAVARSIIPATVNIHLIGDCFAIPIFAFAVLKSFGVEEPTIFNYLIFALYFVLAKFSVAAVPGGGILVMIPILESYLGFTGPMLSLITALYILFDPIITTANVLGNGAFAMGIGQLINGKKQPEMAP